MTVLILGGTGFVSGGIAAQLVEEGHQVTLLTRGRRPLPAGCRSLLADRSSPDALQEALMGRTFDLAIDCLCFTPADAESAIRALSGRIGRYVMISTDFVYGPEAGLPMDEASPRGGMNPYGLRKTLAEDCMIEACGADGFPVTVLRPPHVMGAGGYLGVGSLHLREPGLPGRMERGEPLFLLDTGNLLVQPVYHRDIGRACLAVAGREATLGRAYNCAGPEAVTTRQYHDAIAATLGVEPNYISVPSEWLAVACPDRLPFCRHRTYSMTALQADSGYRPETGLLHCIFEMVDWLQSSAPSSAGEPRPWEGALAAILTAAGQELAGWLHDGGPA